MQHALQGRPDYSVKGCGMQAVLCLLVKKRKNKTIRRPPHGPLMVTEI